MSEQGGKGDAVGWDLIGRRDFRGDAAFATRSGDRCRK
jgi:hypothetical protein